MASDLSPLSDRKWTSYLFEKSSTNLSILPMGLLSILDSEIKSHEIYDFAPLNFYEVYCWGWRVGYSRQTNMSVNFTKSIATPPAFPFLGTTGPSGLGGRARRIIIGT